MQQSPSPSSHALTPTLATYKQTKTHYELQTKSLSLQPYKRSFVPEYHTWFHKYPQLLHLTGSQPLTLQQQLQNHKSWLEDISKYTFIVWTKQDEQSKPRMIGDVNLFFSDWIEKHQAQINVMIAVSQFRGKGLSKEIMEVIQLFSWGVYDRSVMIAKIKKDNTSSIKLFQKIGYNFIQDNPHYDQKQYRKTINISKQQAYKKLVNQYKMKQVTDIHSLYSQ